MAGSLLCDNAGPSVPCPLSALQTLRLGFKAREMHFTRPDVYSPSFNPKVFWKLHLPPEPVALTRIAGSLQLGPVPGPWRGAAIFVSCGDLSQDLLSLQPDKSFESLPVPELPLPMALPSWAQLSPSIPHELAQL